ncbi:MAG: DNA recombination protein RmuC [Peptococcaceae bacterium]|jgi:DNA recombination protein RmuC|nr:DNA recombination protein RmuC [Peptococcaceae bacterium]
MTEVWMVIGLGGIFLLLLLGLVQMLRESRRQQELVSGLIRTRQDLLQALAGSEQGIVTKQGEVWQLQKTQMSMVTEEMRHLTATNETRMNRMYDMVNSQLKELRGENNQAMEEMRRTVDEKLQQNLEQRLNDSFRLVSERLEQVYRGLGEMQQLAAGVGDLKKVLANVKVRGTWGEVQLGNILEQILAPEQYAANVTTKKGSNDRVEFAVKLPAAGSSGSWIYLPIDAKFPLEDYQRILQAEEQGDVSAAKEYGKQLVTRVKAEAKSIKEKYLNPPDTTDFAILFLPIEGLYAAVLQQEGLTDQLQRDYRVVVAGPTTLAALLNSLQMGFRTLAVEQRAGEVWSLLGAVKTDFGRFALALEKTQKKLQEASNTIDDASRKTRVIERKLRGVEALPVQDSEALLWQEESVMPMMADMTEIEED